MCNCCNQKRAAYSSENSNSKKGMVKVILKENSPLIVNGNVTGRMYIFNKINDVNWIDNRDILSLTENNKLHIVY